ncbi:tRNA adenosine(34) deaminase TadA [Alkalibaculum bacchi]|uniref:tRNA adenosine(34) deaminase TadA n=1 Tax=Alkalibaculum bacchi TaxID=645887 RepID=UPI0026F0C2BB|nr:tRNA adenosine(34) deaminase TadA [Alkalibaculum bacchi]
MRKYMEIALNIAKEGMNAGEVPVGAIIVKNNEIISMAHNEVETSTNPIAHAEVLAIQRACEIVGNWRLSDCTLYVTLEPCIMCMGAIFNSRISKLVYGAGDNKLGAVESQSDFIHNPLFKNIDIYPGILEEECIHLMQQFFKKIR